MNPDEAPLLLRDGVGIWAEQLGGNDYRGKPCLFLDRDGVVVEEVDFLSRPEDMLVSSGIAEAIARVNAMGLPVVLVTNQSGIARGLFGWDEFRIVQEALVERLAVSGARLDAVFACAYHPFGTGPLAIADHPWRKPGAGMLLAAHELFDMDLSRSWIVGDRVSDLEAGFSASIAGGSLVMTGFGRGQMAIFDEARTRWRNAGYASDVHDDPASAVLVFADWAQAVQSR